MRTIDINPIPMVILIGVLAALIGPLFQMPKEEPVTLERIEQETGLDLPGGTKLIRSFEQATVFDPIWVAKVQIPVASYEAVKGEVQNKPTDNTKINGALADSTDWWNPTGVAERKQYLADDHTLVVLVLANEENEFYIYIECIIF